MLAGEGVCVRGLSPVPQREFGKEVLENGQRNLPSVTPGWHMGYGEAASRSPCPRQASLPCPCAPQDRAAGLLADHNQPSRKDGETEAVGRKK